MHKYKRIRKKVSEIEELRKINIRVTYYYLKKNYDEGLIKGFEIKNVVDLDYENLLKHIKEK